MRRTKEFWNIFYCLMLSLDGMVIAQKKMAIGIGWHTYLSNDKANVAFKNSVY